jgi:predicted negative regulator of RcsB-dependent stress response
VALDSHEDDDLEKIKQWWKENGTAVILGISLGLAAIFGWRGWQMYQQNQGESASHLYQQAYNQFRQGQGTEARTTTERLLMEYSNSTYASLASLLLAAHQASAKGQPQAAIAHLDWVIHNSKLDALKELAQLRKASILLAENQADKALAIVDGHVSDAFKPAYMALKGDIFLKQGDSTKAQEFYQQAMQAQEMLGPQRQWLELKLNDLGTLPPAVIAQISAADKALREAVPATDNLPLTPERNTENPAELNVPAEALPMEAPLQELSAPVLEAPQVELTAPVEQAPVLEHSDTP